MEGLAIAGARKLLTSEPPSYVFMELHVPLLELAGSSPTGMMAQMEAHGYTLISPPRAAVLAATGSRGVLDTVEWRHRN